MSAGGVFKLIANDGKPDRLLVATALLNQRIKDVICARRKTSADPTPTLLDIERTHILFVNAHFKPFAAIGYEYNKVRSSTGTPTFGGSVQFSIPQFGDFFHDMVLHAVLTPTYADLLTSPATASSVTGPYGIVSKFPAVDTDWDGTAQDGSISTTTYALVDAFGTSITANTALAYRNMVRYVEYPFERLCTKVAFSVNGNPLDEYTSRAANMLRNFTISDEKLVGYKRLNGQEVPFEGFSGPRACAIEDTEYDSSATVASSAARAAVHGAASGTIAGSQMNAAKTPATYMTAPAHQGGGFASNQWSKTAAAALVTTQVDLSVGLETTNAELRGGAGPSLAQYGHVQRQCLSAVDGPQTPKYWQPTLEMWNPLHFWFNKDARLSIPSVAIPFGQRFITVDLASVDEVIVDFPGCFVAQTVTDYSHITVDTDIPVATDAAGTTYRNFRPYWQRSTITAPTISVLELYINNIFVNPEVHDIFIKRVGFSLIRVFRGHYAQQSNASQSELLSQLKWPIECLFVGFQPVINLAKATNPNYHRDWHRMSKTFDSICELRQQSLNDLRYTGIAGDDTTASVNLQHVSSIGQIVPDTYVVERPTVTELSLTAHGIKLYDTFPQAFFSSYEPYHYGGDAIRPSRDAGAMMFNFGLFTGCYQPSGYLNTSRARELYMAFTSNYITTSTPVMFIGIGVAINFLLITDGSAVLRYST